MHTDSISGGFEMIGLGWIILMINISANYIDSQFHIHLPQGVPCNVLWVEAVLNNAHHVFTFGLGAFQLYVTYLGYKKIKKQTDKSKGE